jgi:hypothetical protein
MKSKGNERRRQLLEQQDQQNQRVQVNQWRPSTWGSAPFVQQ